MNENKFTRFKITIMSQIAFLAILSKRASKITKKKKDLFFENFEGVLEFFTTI